LVPRIGDCAREIDLCIEVVPGTKIFAQDWELVDVLMVLGFVEEMTDVFAVVFVLFSVLVGFVLFIMSFVLFHSLKIL